MGIFGRRARRTDRSFEPRVRVEANRPRATEGWVAVDVETATPSRDSLCAVAAVRVVEGNIVDQFYELVMPPGNLYNNRNTMVHGLSPAHTVQSRSFEAVSVDLWNFIGTGPIVAHNVSFDRDVFRQTHSMAGVQMSNQNLWLCSMETSKAIWPELPNYRLNDLCETNGIPLNHHNAQSDASACALLTLKLLDASKSVDIESLSALVSKRKLRAGSPSSGQGEAFFPKQPRISPNDWSGDEVRQAQAIVDLWLEGKKLSEIDAVVGTDLGGASSLLNRLRRNGLDVPNRTRGKQATWESDSPNHLVVTKMHLGKRRAMAKDTPQGAKIVVFTGQVQDGAAGVSRIDLTQKAEEAGWIVRNTVTKKTTVLVRCDPVFSGGKVTKALEIGTTCLTPTEFLERLES